MSYESSTRLDGSTEITFLYRIAEGVAEGSFGIECARLAGLPEPVLDEARVRATSLQDLLSKRAQKRKCVLASLVVEACSSGLHHQGPKNCTLIGRNDAEQLSRAPRYIAEHAVINEQDS